MGIFGWKKQPNAATDKKLPPLPDGPRPTTVHLVVPHDLYPQPSDELCELRWRALKAHYETNAELRKQWKPGKIPPIVVPSRHLAAYCLNKLDKLDENEDIDALAFFRKVLLVLVGGEDLLSSIVNDGKFKGRNVLAKLNDALDTICFEHALQSKTKGEQEFYKDCIVQLRDDKARERRSRRSRRMWGVFWLSFAVAWYLGYLGNLSPFSQKQVQTKTAEPDDLGAVFETTMHPVQQGADFWDGV